MARAIDPASGQVHRGASVGNAEAEIVTDAKAGAVRDEVRIGEIKWRKITVGFVGRPGTSGLD